MADLLDQYDIEVPDNTSGEPDLLDTHGIETRPKYIATPADKFGGNEKVMVENGSKIIDAPGGTGKFFEGVLIDDAFDHGYGKRQDGSFKGDGYFGRLQRPDGDFSTEISIGVNIDGKETEIPTLVPTLNQEEIDYLLGGNNPTDEIINKAVRHARLRISEGKSPFAGRGDAEPSSTLEETVANFEKQGAMAAWVAGAFGMVSSDEVAPFIADRSKALASAQNRAPEYMRQFNEKWEKANGVFEGLGVMMDSPRAFGRMVVTQTPNGLFPIITGWAGAQTGALIGAAGGPTAPITSTGGAIIGGAVGTFPGSAFSEVGSQIDELVTEAGYDPTDARSITEAFNNPELMEEIKQKALRKGLTTATVDALFQVVGGKITKKVFSSATSGVVKKTGAVAADVGVQSVGEFSGEAAGQYARDQQVDWKEAMLEGVTSIGQSAAQTGLGYAYRGGKQVVMGGDATTPEQAQTAVQEMQEAAVAETQAQDIAATEIEGVAPEQVQQIVTDFMDGIEPDTANFDEAQQEAIQGVLDKAKPVRDKLIRGRIRKLDTDIEAKLAQIDTAETALAAAREDGKGTKRLEQRVEKLAQEWEAMDEERGNLMTVENPVVEGEAVLDKDVTVKGKDIENAAIKASKQTVLAVNSAFRQARIAAKKDIKNVQKSLAKAIRNSGLDEKSQSDFIGAITSIQTPDQLKKQAPKIQARIEAKINETRKSKAIADIKGLLKRVGKSNVIAVDYVKKIQDMVGEIDLKKRSDKTVQSLQATMDYATKNGTENLPKNVLNKLDILNKKKIEDITPSDLEDMADSIRNLVDLGRTKLKLMKAREAAIQQKRMKELAAGSVKLDERPLKRAPLGEKLAILDRVKNKFIEGTNAIQRLNINKNPMDVIFDIMDGNKQYKGANHKIFKQTIDTGFGKYLDLRESVTRAVKNLQDKLDLSAQQYEKIGVYAAAQQENGREKLLSTGITEKEIDNLKLSKEEMEMYELMRGQLDSMVPALREIMRVSYNKDFEAVENYFPFMTDFDAMDGYEVQDMIGDSVPVITKKKNVEKGFTISRKGGKQKIRIDAMNVFLKHVDNASYLIGLGADIKQLSDIATSDEFGSIAGDMGQAIVADWLDLLARKGSLPGQISFLDTFRRNAGSAVLAFKLSSIMIQPTSLMDGASLVGGTWVTKGVADVTQSDWRKFLKDNFPEIRERAGDDPGYMDLGGGALAKAREAGYWALKNMDLLSASAVAAGAYRKSLADRGIELDLTQPDAQAIQEAQLYMRRTQSSGFAKDAAPILSQGKLTGHPSVDKLILQFQSFVLNRWSIIQHDLPSAVRGKRTAQALNIATWLILANVSENFIRHWTKEMVAAVLGTEPPPDDEEDKASDEIVAQAIGNMPIVGSIVNSFEYGSVPIPAISLVEKIAESAQYGNKSKNGDKKLRHYGSAAILTSGVLGVPGALQAQQLYSGAMKEYVVEPNKKRSSSAFTSN